MTELDQAIQEAFLQQGKQDAVNKVHLLFLKTSLYLPVKKETPVELEEPFAPLFVKEGDSYFMPLFDTLDRLVAWAGDHFDQMNYVEIMGADCVRGVNEKVYLCLNYGTDFYKEFSPDEVKYLKKVVARIDQLKEK